MYKTLFGSEPQKCFWQETRGQLSDFEYKTSNYIRVGCFKLIQELTFGNLEFGYQNTRRRNAKYYSNMKYEEAVAVLNKQIALKNKRKQNTVILKIIKNKGDDFRQVNF